MVVALFDQHEALDGWCVESRPNETLAYGYQTFGERRLFTKFSAGHGAALERWLDDYEKGKRPAGPVEIAVSHEIGHPNPERFRFDLADAQEPD